MEEWSCLWFEGCSDPIFFLVGKRWEQFVFYLVLDIISQIMWGPFGSFNSLFLPPLLTSFLNCSHPKDSQVRRPLPPPVESAMDYATSFMCSHPNESHTVAAQRLHDGGLWAHMWRLLVSRHSGGPPRSRKAAISRARAMVAPCAPRLHWPPLCAPPLVFFLTSERACPTSGDPLFVKFLHKHACEQLSWSCSHHACAAK